MSPTASNHTYDPLSTNLTQQTKAFLASIETQQGQEQNPLYAECAKYIRAASSPVDLLERLSESLVVPEFTWRIAKFFRPLLIDLFARWVITRPEMNDRDWCERRLAALAFIVEVHEELFPVLHRFLQIPTFTDGPLAFLNLQPSLPVIETQRFHRLLLAYYRLLQINRELPKLSFWSSTPLSKLIWTPELDNGTRLLAIKCYALQTGMAEAEREKVECEVLGELFQADCPLAYIHEDDATPANGRKGWTDGWLLPVLESTRVRRMRQSIAAEVIDFYSQEGEEPFWTISSNMLCPLVCNVHGVFLLQSQPSKSTHSSLIPTPTAQASLRSLALRLSLRVPILLTSPPSSGKALFIQHLAEQLYPTTTNHVVTIHLADTSLDARSLLGSYISSTTNPGTFEWKEGVLVRSMRQGKWIVFEDIDRGSNDVLGVIKPLVESLHSGKWIGGRATLDIPTRGRVIAADSFAIFATRSVVPLRGGKGETFPSPTFFGAHKFHEVIIPSPSLDELKTIIDTRLPRLAGSVAQAQIGLWESVKALGASASSRDIGLRELEKFCTRVDRLLPTAFAPMDIDIDSGGASPSFSSIFPNPSLREEIYLEARDVFFGSGTLTSAARAHSEMIANVIGDLLGLDNDRQTWLLQGRTPEIDIAKGINGQTVAIRFGTVRLLAREIKNDFSAFASTRPFAMHKPAISLMSRIATAISLVEPVLLTGETGTGKTSVISHLASTLHYPLVSLNLSHQTESSDLLGGFKPIDARVPASQLQERWLSLFGSTFSRKKNEKFETEVRKAVLEAKWKRAVGLWKESARLASERLAKARQSDGEDNAELELDSVTPRKRRRVAPASSSASEANWSKFLRDVEEFEVQFVHGKGKFAFGFVEGPLVKAIRAGHWVLLDEINLAGPETLECITSLLHGPTASITLTEQGSLEPIPRHPDFRLFACMNPATDVGKKDLPPNIRSRFTEIDVPPPDADRETLLSIITQYIGAHSVGDKAAIMDIAEFYTSVKSLAGSRQIADGSNHRPHFSMRTLARALTFAGDIASRFGLRRGIWEGCLMAFTMVLDFTSAEAVTALAQKHLLAGVKNPRSILGKQPSLPEGRSAEEFVKFGPFHLEKGPLAEDFVDDYIMTPSVERKLVDLARIIMTRRFPVLIEGPTSSGKTSSIEYLARRTGHRFIRINNHEHTDIQEYVGSYVSDPSTGKLSFKDGLLVRALRNGDWIVLDELNLAPTDVLEALNRLLDDNRELVIPETQEVIKPHPHFMLFATQNPPGLYAGRKVLSRAFRNRFLEVHFDDVPQNELETILCERCRIAPSYGKRIVQVFLALQKRRQTTRVFESKQGFATLRDLFRWAGRDAIGYQELAENGYMLLAERARRDDDKVVVKEVIESVMGVRIDEKALYDLHGMAPGFLGCSMPSTDGIIWTNAMQRLFVLTARALRFDEPVLLVGETGSGKTSVCQVFADATNQKLFGLNCHQNTETADIIGGLRPVRNRSVLVAEVIQEILAVLGAANLDAPETPTPGSFGTHLRNLLKRSDLPNEVQQELRHAQRKLLRLQSIFEWHDGPLVEAMRGGDLFLLDEISLADDSVLERLNSVLEPGRTIVLAERAGDESEHPTIKASSSFKLVATMNPGGDYGKKELSPALRNRFTEIWVPRVDDRKDLELIIGRSWGFEDLRPYTTPLLDFTEWLCGGVGDASLAGLRDYLAWVHFMNAIRKSEDSHLSLQEIFHHAARMTFLDGLSSVPQLSSLTPDAFRRLRDGARVKLQELVPLPINNASTQLLPVCDNTISVQIGPFSLPQGSKPTVTTGFNFQAPTTRDNAMRIIRACQLHKPILLEGSPGVGKTSLIIALASLAGHTLSRINLSDQTDLIDLFGADLPVEGGAPGEFAWKDAEFLRALQEGHWVLLDEMNLAPQAVLEGLNAVLDHRGTVYIPELGRSFTRHPSFRIFAAQNPLSQGGGRKGLPKSFVNRFTKVYIEELSPKDLMLVCGFLFPDLDQEIAQAMITFNMRLSEDIVIKHRFAREGGPWEFNLRDVMRWGTLLCTSPDLEPLDFLSTVYLQRFRTQSDKDEARKLFEDVFGVPAEASRQNPQWFVAADIFQVGNFTSGRGPTTSSFKPPRLLKHELAALESVGHCISQSWLCILTGPQNSGKNNVVRVLANLTGNHLREVSIHSATDTMDILGSFEQLDLPGRVSMIVSETITLLDSQLRTLAGSQGMEDGQHIRKAFLERAQLGLDLSVLDLAQDVVAFLVPSSPATLTLQRKIQDLLTLASSAGRFEWVDGPLVQAMKTGHWLLLDGANLCNPSVLDRLNSLCEPNGNLVLSERGFINGQVPVIRPHPDFRLFMTVDPRFGELSRAMRNRGIEVALLPTPFSDDGEILNDFHRLPFGFPHASAPTLSLFEQLRRGSFTSGFPSLHPSTGHSLDQDSRLTPLIDHSPMLVTSPEVIAAPHVHMLCRTVSVAALPLLGRFTSVQISTPYGFNNITKVLSSQIPSILERYLEHCALSRNIAITTLKVQPLDFILNRPDRHIDSSTSHPSIQEVIQVTDLAISLNVERSDLISNRGAHVAHLDLFNAIEKVFDHIQGIACKLIDMEPIHWRACQNQMVKTLELVNVCGYFRSALGSELLDFSRVFAVLHSLCHVVEDTDQFFSEVAASIRSLASTLTLSSGEGLVEIWSHLFDSSQIEASAQVRGILDHLCSGTFMDNEKISRRNCYDFVSLYMFPKGLTSQKILELAPLKIKLDQTTASPGMHANEERRATSLNELMLVQELRIFSPLANNSTSVENIQKLLLRILNISLLAEPKALSRLSAYQNVLWVADAGQDLGPTLAFAHMQWLECLWDLDEDNDVLVLLRPTQLLTIAKYCHSTIPLTALHNYQQELQHYVSIMELCCEDQLPRITQLVQVFIQSVEMLVHCFGPSPDFKFPDQAWNEHKDQGEELIRKTIDLLESVHTQPLASRVAHSLLPIMREALQDSNKDILPRRLGKCFLAIGRVIFDLYVPNLPLDPASIQGFTSDRIRHQQTELLTQIQLHERLESLVTGNSISPILCFLRHQLEKLVDTLPSAPPQTSTSPRDVALVQTFWSEVLQFKAHILSSTKLESLVTSLERDEENATTREHVLQQSIKGFRQRMGNAYTTFRDLIAPLTYSTLLMQTGLRMMTISSTPQRDRSTSGLVGLVLSLTAYPSASSALSLCSETSVRSPSFTPHQALELRFAAIAADHSNGIAINAHISAIDMIYNQAIRLWLIDKAQQSEREVAEQSLYRKKHLDYQPETEAEIEAREFAELFPSFEEYIEDHLQPVQSKAALTSFVSLRAAQAILSTHLRLFCSGPRKDTRTPFDTLRRTLAISLVNSHLPELPQSLDVKTLHLQFSLISDAFSSFSSSSGTDQAFDFYHEPRVCEIKKASIIAENYLQRLSPILEEFPDQGVLHDLRARCEVITNLDIQSPVAKVLTALESLHFQTENWEMYANRDNSLRQQQQDLANLIVEWRRLELACWQKLLEAQAKAFADEAADWWFRLYDALVRGPLDALQQGGDEMNAKVTEYLSSLVPLVDDFITSSTLGQFHRRYELLESFSRYLFALEGTEAETNTRQAVLYRTRCILRSTIRRFNHFAPRIVTSLSNQRATLEKEIREFIKLASWKDINVHALKQSAQRTHHKLYKTIRKFREVLRQPITQLLIPEHASDEDAVGFDASSIPFPWSSCQDSTHLSFSTIPSLTSSARHLQNLGKTYFRFEGLLANTVRPFISSRAASDLDELAVFVITTSKELSNLSVPLSDDATKRQKHLKALLVRKRKAWSDLLKELKRVGLSAHLKPEILRQQLDPRWMREQPVLDSNLEDVAMLSKADGYFHRLSLLLPQLREALSNHHTDIGTRELQRGLFFVEHGLSIGLQLRTSVLHAFSRYRKLLHLQSRLEQLRATPDIAACGGILPPLRQLGDLLARTAASLDEAVIAVRRHVQLLPCESDGLATALTELHQNTTTIREKLLDIIEDANAGDLHFLLEDERKYISTATHHISNVVEALGQWIQKIPVFTYLLQPIRDFISSQPLPDLQSISPEFENESIANLLNSLLVAVQGVSSHCPQAPSTEEDDQNYLIKDYIAIQNLTRALSLESVYMRFNSVVGWLISHNAEIHLTLLNILPFIDQYLALVGEQLSMHANWTAALFKLQYIICSVALNIAKQGFCQPPESEQDSKAGGEGVEVSSGTGLGAGSGSENISKEIEDESQVEGLQGEEGEPEGKDDRKDDEDTVEMGEDFGGDLEDAQKGEEEEEGQKSDEEDVNELEERMEDLDAADPSAVDEKLWGDDEGPQDVDQQNDKLDQDRSKQESGNSEVVAKEDNQPSKQQDKQPESANTNEISAEDAEIDNQEPEDQKDDDFPDASGAPMDEYIPDANALDLPDDLDLGDNKEASEDLQLADDEMLDEDMDEAGSEPDGEDLPGAEGPPDVEGEDQTQPPTGEPPTQINGEEQKEEDQPLEAQADEAVARPDLAPGQGDAMSEEPMRAEAGQDGSAGASGHKDNAGSEANFDGAEQQANESSAPNDADSHTAKMDSQPEVSGTGSGDVQQGSAPAEAARQIPINPLRNLGDAVKQIQKRFDEILDSQQGELPESQGDPPTAPSQVEYLRPDDVDHDMQALGPADEEQVARLNDLNLVDEDDNYPDTFPMGVDEAPESDLPENVSREGVTQNNTTGTEHQKDVEGAVLHNQEGTSLFSGDHDLLPKAEAEAEEDTKVEAELRHWQANQYPEGAEHIWRQYESLTHDLAYALCEQLRLILEPTLASRLKGDYRTGKRLNMKKIISYIASDYTKDKIWLRRTRPSQREYQILVALDDSRSMAESHSVHLAYQTLALVSKALTRLESGDLAIARFGEHVDILHGFDQGPFTDQAGMKVMSAFKFNQRATNVLSLLETSLKALEAARERKAMGSATAAELWQLEIIISDGICQDHERLRALLRKAEEQRVMVVFIIIDSLHSAAKGQGSAGQNSILSMDMAEYKNVDGRMELQLRKYLDSFPFEYYVVLRSVEALPDVLSGTLKQFLERISEE